MFRLITICHYSYILYVQDDEYFASLQADREKELKAREEAEIRKLEEQVAAESALIEERKKEEELQRKLEELQVMEIICFMYCITLVSLAICSRRLTYDSLHPHPLATLLTLLQIPTLPAIEMLDPQ